ncbi:MAG: hypothetical protein A2W00_12345 [Candidatus Eisenbacteria bacterium RBG_16_71_46]|nr:MAG: hypothetical protein A2W00_12345 [Candidatus Eisenbacteria bacterium RBG_16_71_46]OGF21880.1 MAG: hypothetical protein A2V63_03525 [Candidatus Eisenbacteria bacterium RBG_19FT_COMBO_70_11]
MITYVLAQLLIVIYSSHRYVILWRWLRGVASRPAAAPAVTRCWPVVTVQLPLFNERLVAERLIDAVCALDYPAGRLEIQVLDDSLDETRERAARAVDRHRAHGVDIVHLHRRHREGYKAGALAMGLGLARGDLIAVFDADFVPRADFLRRMVPHFADPRVGMAQARWGHLNRRRSALTSAQAVMLDSHFLLEHAVRMQSRLFFNFNGTAGVWRRSCIEDAGGWAHDTLTEDLDLSYRAQLRGWRFVFDGTVESPAELPADIEALKSQQRRWAKGSIQTARKLLPRVFASPLPLRIKLEAFFHLTSNFSYPLLLVLGLLLLPILLGTSSAPPALVWGLQIGVILLGVVPVSLFLGAGQLLVGGSGPGVLRDVVAALVLGVGLSVNNTRAVLEGLGSGIGDWERTPKSGDGATRPRLQPYASSAGHSGRTELGLALYFMGLACFAWGMREYRALPFIILLLAGFGCVGVASLRASLRAAR